MGRCINIKNHGQGEQCTRDAKVARYCTQHARIVLAANHEHVNLCKGQWGNDKPCHYPAIVDGFCGHHAPVVIDSSDDEDVPNEAFEAPEDVHCIISAPGLNAQGSHKGKLWPMAKGDKVFCFGSSPALADQQADRLTHLRAHFGLPEEEPKQASMKNRLLVLGTIAGACYFMWPFVFESMGPVVSESVWPMISESMAAWAQGIPAWAKDIAASV